MRGGGGFHDGLVVNGLIVLWSLNEWNYGEQSNETLLGIHVACTDYRDCQPPLTFRLDRQFYFMLVNGT